MKPKFKNILIFSTCLLMTGISYSQTQRVVSLKEVLELGLQSSKRLRLDTALVAEAEGALASAKNQQWPDFKMGGSYLRLGNALVDLKMSPSPNGATGSLPRISQALYGTANFSLPVFAGGRVRYGIESAKYLLKAAELGARQDRDAVAYNLVQAYANLFKAAQVMGVLQENVKASQQRDSNFLRLELNGLLARNDRLKAQLQTSAIELQLLEAQNDFNIANVNMDLMLGLPEATQLQVDAGFVTAPFEDRPYAYYEQLALQNRKDMEAVDYRQKAAALQVKSIKAESYPSLALTGGYIAAYIPKVITITNALNGGVGLQYNLGNIWKSHALLKQARAREDQVKVSGEMLIDQIRLDLNRDYQNVRVAKLKIWVFDKAVVQAEENFRITQNKYNNSLVTITDLLDANVALLSARIQVMQAKADAATAYQKLLETSGVILQ